MAYLPNLTAPCSLLMLAASFLATTHAANFEIVNNCTYTVWAAARPGGGRRLDAGQTWNLWVAPGTSMARIWGRTGCNFDGSGRGRCQTGDCSGVLNCQSSGAPPNTLAEFALNQNGNQDFYDISLVDGFNIPMDFHPLKGGCHKLSCTADINGECPNELRTQGGCNNPCIVFNTSQYCCTNRQESCGPTNYSRFFKDRCNDSYSYPKDDATSTFTCPAGSNYTVVFCPLGNSNPHIQMPAQVPAQAPRPSFSPSATPPKSDNHQFWKRKVVIGVASAVVGGFMLCIIVICCFRYKSLTRPVKFCVTTKSDLDIEAFLKTQGAVAQKRFKFSEVKKMTNSFKVKLGQGGFGAVYKGNLPTGCSVAVKLLKESKGNGEEFINEVASISRTSHVNIVTLLGFCLKGSKKALIYEFMANGSLEKFIYKRGPETIVSLSWENLYQISIGIARGLEYLHRGCNTRILHFDIKPHNILLDENFCPKISDFGLAKLCPGKESIISMSNTRGTMGYVAPEMWNRHFGGVSYKSDVYSYGMLLLEMVGGRKNINAEASHTSEIYFPHQVYKRLELDTDLRPDEVMTTEENEIAKRMTIVGLWCIQTFPNDRPTMSRVIDMLEGDMNSLEMPPKPVLSSPTRSVTESSS